MKVVVAYDGSDHAKNALFFALNLIKKEDEIHLVTIVKEAPRSPEQVIIQSEQRAKQMQDEVVSELSDYKIVTKNFGK